MASRTLLRYIELKSLQSNQGPAWIAHVRTSKTGHQIYFNGKALVRVEGSRHMDVETREIYWVSGVKKNGEDRHWAGGGKVCIERSAVAEYLAVIGAARLDERRLVVVEDLPPTDTTHFHERANHSHRENETDFAELAELFLHMDHKLAA
jgi:hypothetical protein